MPNQSMNGSNEPYAVVIGGANMDICGISHRPLVERDSNPGSVTLSAGGVGLNIASNLSLLGLKTYFIAAIGNDAHGERLAEICKKLDIDTSYCVFSDETHTSVYLFIADSDGDTRLAVSDMEICALITPRRLEIAASLIKGARVCVADANISAESMLWLAENCGTKLFVDPVSTKKAMRLERALGHIDVLRPNRIEAEALMKKRLPTALDEAKALVKSGVKSAFVADGRNGVAFADSVESFCVEAVPAEIKSLTGAGDCLTAALAYAYSCGFSAKKAARFACAASSFAIESMDAVNKSLRSGLVHERAGRFYGDYEA